MRVAVNYKITELFSRELVIFVHYPRDVFSRIFVISVYHVIILQFCAHIFLRIHCVCLPH